MNPLTPMEQTHHHHTQGYHLRSVYSARGVFRRRRRRDCALRALMATSTPREEDAAEGGGSVKSNEVSETAGAGCFDFGHFHALHFPGAMRELLTPTTEPGR